MKPKKKFDYDYMVKAVIIGDSGVGKTNILIRYCDNCFKPAYTSTIGVDFKIKII
jgi:GTPase SAR1 family protein